MKQEYQDLILKACGASSLRVGDNIQTLWSGYGEIVRLQLEGSDRPSVVVKHVKFPKEAEHPGGWNTDRSHRRKVRSYQVETHWYQNYSTNQSCRIPACLAACHSLLFNHPLTKYLPSYYVRSTHAHIYSTRR